MEEDENGMEIPRRNKREDIMEFGGCWNKKRGRMGEDAGSEVGDRRFI